MFCSGCAFVTFTSRSVAAVAIKEPVKLLTNQLSNCSINQSIELLSTLQTFKHLVSNIPMSKIKSPELLTRHHRNHCRFKFLTVSMCPSMLSINQIYCKLLHYTIIQFNSQSIHQNVNECIKMSIYASKCKLIHQTAN